VSRVVVKRVAVLQSNYLPWKGYFDIIRDVDLFVFYDDVQYTKNDWRNRNRIKTRNGVLWLTVPTGSDLNRLVHEVKIVDVRWQQKHWTTVQQAYARAPHFKRYRAFFEDVYLGRRWDTLSDLNQYLIKSIAAEHLGLAAEFADSRQFPTSGKKLDRLMELIAKVGADRYVSGPSARSYIDERRFAEIGVELVYKSYDGYPEYQQPHGAFEHRVSIIDLLFSVGPEASRYIWGWREEKV
jgi:hypothetical protein